MKKLTISMLLAMFVAVSAFSQEEEEVLTNKKGKPILPTSGEFALGIGANNIFSYVGNMFNGSAFNSLSTSFVTSENYIYGKYFLSDNTAIRGKFRLGLDDENLINMVQDDNNVDNEVEDKRSIMQTNIYLGGGLEKRIGKSRIQGIYGGELALFSNKQKTKYTYGNSYEVGNTTPTTTTDFDFSNEANVFQRALEEKIANNVGFGLRAFAGVEYFILPKISLGFEFGWGITFSKQGEVETTIEYWDFADVERVEETVTTNGSKNTEIDTDVMNGQIFLLFHFGN